MDSTISRIYDLKTIGVQSVIADLDKITAKLNEVAAAKAALFKGVTLSLDQSAGGLGGNLSTAAINLSKLQSMVSEFSAAKTKAAEANRTYMDAVREDLAIELNAAKVKTEAAKQSATEYSALMRGEVDAAKASTEASKQNTEAKRQQALAAKTSADEFLALSRAETEEAKQNTEIAKQKRIELEITIELQKQKEDTERKAKKAAEQLAKESNAYEKLKKEYRDTANAAKALAAEFGVGSVQAQAMTDKASSLNAQLLKVETSVGQYQRSVGNYQNATFALSQLIREAPAFANSVQTGLMALSNNFPILFDQFEKLRIEVGSTGEALKIMFGSIFDFTNLFILGFAAFEIFGKDLMTAGGAANAAREATNQYASAVHGLAEEMERLAEQERVLIEADIKLEKGIDLSVEAYKAKEEALAAYGIKNNQVYDAEEKQFNAAQLRRTLEKNALDDKVKQLTEIEKIIGKASTGALQATDNSLWNEIKELFRSSDASVNPSARAEAAKKIISSSVLPLDVQEDIKVAIDKAKKDGADLYKALEKQFNEYKVKRINAEKDLSKKTEEITNAQIKFNADKDRLIFNKNIELEKQIGKEQETLRQLREKEDATTVTKIVNDTRAKYRQLADDITKNRETYRLSVTTPENIKYTDKNIEAYDRLLRVLRAIGKQEEENLIFEREQQEYSKRLQTDTSIASEDAALARGSASFGLVSYEALTDALDKETEAKKIAIKNQFINEAASISDSGQLIKLQQQRDAKIEQVDRDSYVKRLGLATDYLTRITRATVQASDIAITEIDRVTTNKITSILQSDAWSGAKQKQIQDATDLGVINKSNEQIIKARSILPDVQEATKRAKAALDEAEGTDKKTDALNAYNNALLKQKAIEDDLAKALNAKANAQNRIDSKQIELTKTIEIAALDVARQSANEYIAILQKRDNYRIQSFKTQLDWTRKVRDSETQSLAEKQRNERADFIKDQQLEREKQRQEERRARASLAINYAIGSMRIWATAVDPVEAGIAEAALSAQFVASNLLLSKARAYAKGKNPETHLALVGDGYEHEAVNVNGNYFVTPNRPTLVNMPNNARVTPFSMMSNYSGMGQQLQAPSFFSNNTRGSGGDLYSTVSAMSEQIQTIAGAMMNQKVVLDTSAAGRAIGNRYYNKVTL